MGVMLWPRGGRANGGLRLDQQGGLIIIDRDVAINNGRMSRSCQRGATPAGIISPAGKIRRVRHLSDTARVSCRIRMMHFERIRGVADCL